MSNADDRAFPLSLNGCLNAAGLTKMELVAALVFAASLRNSEHPAVTAEAAVKAASYLLESLTLDEIERKK